MSLPVLQFALTRLRIRGVMNRSYKLLGTLAIEDDVRPSTLMKYSKGCALLAYLIITRQSYSREALGELFWEATSTAQSLQNLRAVLFKLRSFTPELVATKKRVSFEDNGRITIDLYLLEAKLDSQDTALLDEALALYTGDLLAGFYLDDAPKFGEWLLLAKERLRQRVWDGYFRVCTAYYEAQTWQQGVETARRWLHLDPLDESIHQWLMKFLAANGQKTAALEQFAKCRELLWAELGVEPDAKTIALFNQIQELPEETLPTFGKGQADLPLPSPNEVAALGALPPHSYLPYHRNAVFTGRLAELQQLAETLLPTEATRGRLTKSVVITGMGGLGKSQLAVEFAYRYGRFYPGGVYWLNLAVPENVYILVAALGGEGRMNLFADKDNLSLTKQSELVKRAWQEPIPRLLIFDNCEDENLAADWLPVSGECSVLITSRYSNWSRALPITAVPLETLPRPESITLLQNLADTLANADAHLVAAEVGDWPLALHLAGSFLGRFPTIQPPAYLQQLREQQLLQHTSLQGHHTRYSPTGHELDIARTFAVSLNRLDLTDPVDNVARRLLASAACLAPNEPIPLALLYQVAQDEPAAIQALELLQAGSNRLLSLGFLNAVDDKTVIIHHLVALFTTHSLADDLLLAEAETAVAYTLNHQLRRHRQTYNSLATLPFSSSHLRHTTNQALSREDSQAGHLANMMGEHLVEIADFQEARTYLEQAQIFILDHFGPTSLEMAEWANIMGNLCLEMGQYEKAKPYFVQALEIRRQALGDNHLDVATCLNNIAGIYLRLGPYMAAQRYLEEALSIRERLLGSDHTLTLAILNNLGVMYNFLGDRPQARLYFEQVLVVRERTLGKDHPLTAPALNNLGDLLSRMGEEAEGRPYLERAVTIREQHLGQAHPLTLACQTNLAELLSRIGEYEPAQHHLERALAAALPKLGENHPLTARILNTLGVMFTRMGNLTEAQTQLEQALRIREDVRGKEHQDTAYSLVCLGELHLAKYRPDVARPLFERAVAILEDIVQPTDVDLQRAKSHLAKLCSI